MTKKKTQLSINREFYRIDQKEFGANLIENTKKCTRCKETKPLSMFQHGRGYVDGYYKHCRKCHYDVYVRDNHYKRTYGISQEEYKKRVDVQNGECFICKTKHDPNIPHGRLCVDHCHKTGEIRGLLCSTCNTALGNAKDDPKILRKLAAYLEKFYANK